MSDEQCWSKLFAYYLYYVPVGDLALLITVPLRLVGGDPAERVALCNGDAPPEDDVDTESRRDEGFTGDGLLARRGPSVSM